MMYTKVAMAWKNFVNPSESTQWRYLILLTNEQQESYVNAKICCICKGMFPDKLKMKKIVKLGTIFIIQENIEMLRIAYVV